MRAQRECADVLAPYFEPGALVIRVLENASTRPHIMDFTRLRVLTAMFSLVNKVLFSRLLFCGPCTSTRKNPIYGEKTAKQSSIVMRKGTRTRFDREICALHVSQTFLVLLVP